MAAAMATMPEKATGKSDSRETYLGKSHPLADLGNLGQGLVQFHYRLRGRMNFTSQSIIETWGLSTLVLDELTVAAGFNLCWPAGITGSRKTADKQIAQPLF